MSEGRSAIPSSRILAASLIIENIRRSNTSFSSISRRLTPCSLATLAISASTSGSGIGVREPSS